MKKFIVILATILFSSQFSKAQDEGTMKMVNLGSLFEVTIYYDSGNIMQHGFLTPENKLHASWESYYEDGTKKCVATYDNGVKTGIWYYYYKDNTKRVTYVDNKIVKVEDLDSEF
jgi:antitoxin component YwqK of YwqJK toxin-antitoxin module